MYHNNVEYLYIDYTRFSARKASLKGLPHAEELAKIGAYRDALNGDQITCHKCQLIFQVDDIYMMMQHDNINFEEAGLLVHIIHHPWCDFLKALESKSREKILGIRFSDF